MIYIKQFLLLVLIQFAFISECKKKNLKVTVHYETRCPGCIVFFKEQFSPVWKIFLDVVEFELLPHGHAKDTYVNNDWEFKCQHGPNECEGNQIHACAIYELKEIDLQRLYKYLGCCMKTLDTPANARGCAKTNFINYDEIDKCSHSKKGREILASIGDKYHKLKPRFVPTILFNDVYDKQDDRSAQENLKATICSKLDDINKPRECFNYSGCEKFNLL